MRVFALINLLVWYATLGGAVAMARGIHTDGVAHEWFESLVDPELGVSCCGEGDCHQVGYRAAEDGYDAYFRGQWVAVPDAKISPRRDNPTGKAVLCVSKTLGVMCFVLP